MKKDCNDGICVITEQGDLGLGIDEISQEDQKKIDEATKKEER